VKIRPGGAPRNRSARAVAHASTSQSEIATQQLAKSVLTSSSSANAKAAAKRHGRAGRSGRRWAGGHALGRHLPRHRPPPTRQMRPPAIHRPPGTVLANTAHNQQPGGGDQERPPGLSSAMPTRSARRSYVPEYAYPTTPAITQMKNAVLAVFAHEPDRPDHERLKERPATPPRLEPVR